MKTVQENAELLEAVKAILKQCPHVTFERALDVAIMAKINSTATEGATEQNLGISETSINIGRDDRI